MIDFELATFAGSLGETVNGSELVHIFFEHDWLSPSRTPYFKGEALCTTQLGKRPASPVEAEPNCPRCLKMLETWTG